MHLYAGKLPFDYLPEVAAGVPPHVQCMCEAVLAFVETTSP
jgi:N-formylglutamate deformylase